MSIDQKLQNLHDLLRSMKRVVIGYSGGVDSAFLAKAAYDVLGDGALAVTADSESYAEGELEYAVDLARRIGIPHEIIHTEEMNDPHYAANPINRCYYCKSELFIKLQDVAKCHGASYILYGANADDVGDFRPGMQAAAEIGAQAPLRDVGLTKVEIREMSRRFDLPVWDRPATACLSSRVPYGTAITPEILSKIDRAERVLRDLGFRQVRVRHHDQIARIEILKSEIPLLFERNLTDTIVSQLREIGYIYVTLDLAGFRSGSMNESLKLMQIDKL